MNPQVDILIREYNNGDLPTKLVESIRQNTVGVDYQIIEVDNGSEDYTLACQMPMPHTVVHLPFNHGSVRAINIGLALAQFSPAPFILLLDSDTEIPSGDSEWLKRFVSYFDDPTVGAAGAVTDYVSGYQNAEAVPDRYTKDFRTIEEGILKAEGVKDPIAMPVLVSFAMMLRKEAVEKVGMFDERYEPGNYEDYDYSLQLREAGYKLVIADSVWIHHKGSQTFGKMGFSNLLQVNAQKFIDKWGTEKLAEMGLEAVR